ncbi:AAA family ATPase, partial [Tumidithrix elongata RA019]|nr:AAA family ATPase [Tumidithrix elongata RA019]
TSRLLTVLLLSIISKQVYLFEKDRDGFWFLTDLGKEYVEESLADQLQELISAPEEKADISKYLKFVTFHQSFVYEEFVEGIKPITDELGDIRYRVVDGVFKQICKQAELDPENKYLIIIDEINRANIAKVFGELITLIEDDKRLGKSNELRVTLPYSKELFGVPQNLYILGTMNTSDRSIALLDIALRRRFTFIELKPDPELLKDKNIEGIQLDRVLIQINKSITAMIGRDYQIGHSYFMNIESLEDLRFAWYHRIIPLLQEYFYHDEKRLKVVIGEKFIQKIEMDENLKASLSEFRDPENQFEIADLQGNDFRDAMSKLAGN